MLSILSLIKKKIGMAQETGRFNKQIEMTHKDSTTHALTQLIIQITIKLENGKILINMNKLENDKSN